MTGLMKFLAAGTLAAFVLIATLWPVSVPVADAETPSKPAEYTEKIKDSDVEFKMVGIPGGTYLMGSPAGEPGRNADEGPQHPVTIRPFWMAACETTWDLFDIFQDEMGVEDPKENDERIRKDADAITGPTPPYVDKNYGHPHAGHPAICMTQHCAMEFCRWLSKKTGHSYRLPTEAEWEYAARAGTTTTWSFGNDSKDLGDYAWYKKNSPTEKKTNGGTHKVGSKKPNPWGLYDMYGNVMEWCLDHYQKDYYSTFPKDKPALWPVLVPTERRWSHVARGGSWADDAEQCRSASRRASDPSWMQHDPQQPKSIWWLTKFDVIGFRFVRAVEEQDNLKGLKSKVTRDSD
jgi:formylglycine-generating enzyme required for sulfatase activity